MPRPPGDAMYAPRLARARADRKFYGERTACIGGPRERLIEGRKSRLAICFPAQRRASLSDLWLRKCQRNRSSKRSASMRWIGLASVLIAVALAGPALAGHHWSAYSMGYGVPCPAPCLAPGCCECQPSCCDNVWAGFCQEKARFHHKHQRVAGPCPCATGCDCGGVVGGAPLGPGVPGAVAPSVAPPAAAPNPAVPAAPTPAPPQPVPKTTQHGSYYWPG